MDLEQVQALALAPDGRLLAAGGGTPGERGEVRVLRTTGAETLRLRCGRDLVMGLAWDPRGERLAAATADSSAAVFDRSGKCLLELSGHSGPVLCVGYADEGRVLVTGGADRTLRAWDPDSGRLRHTLTNHTGAVLALAPRPGTGGYLATGGEDRTVRVWQPGIGRMVRIVRGQEGPVPAVAWAPDGKRLYSACADGLVRAIDGESDTIQGSWRASATWVQCLAAWGDLLTTGDAGGTVRVWEPGAILTGNQAR